MTVIAIVLEDQASRVEWLRGVLIGWRIDWYASVKPFITAVKRCAPSLVVLDHDLGVAWTRGVLSGDVDGLTGTDAVARMPVVTCPVLVWSMNPVRAPQMADDLVRRNMRARWAPFGTQGCADAIATFARAARVA